MFGFLRRNKNKPPSTDETEPAQEAVPETAADTEATAPAIVDDIQLDAAQLDVPLTDYPPKEKPKGVFASLRNRLSKTRHSLTDGMGDLVLGKKIIDDDFPVL